MHRVQRTITKRLAANWTAVLKSTGPRQHGRSAALVFKRAARGQAIETTSFNAFESAGADYKGLIGFGKPAADSRKPLILFELREISVGEKVKIYEKSANKNK